MERVKRGYRGGAKKVCWAVELSFKAPVLFRGEATQYWRVPSDTLFRGIWAAMIKLYGVEKAAVVEDKATALSSMILLKDGTPYIPNCGMNAYVTMDELDAVDATEIIGTKFMLRIPRGEEFEPVPFEYNALNTVKFRWLVVGTCSEENLPHILTSFRLLGDIGIGAKRSRGFGRFSVVGEGQPEDYGLKISEEGLLASRYLPMKQSNVEVREAYYDSFEVSLGAGALRLTVLAEGSKITRADEGKVEFAKDNLGNRVPVLLRPVIVAPAP